MERVISAVLLNIDNWRDRVLECEASAVPTSKACLLSLARDIEMARRSLMRLTGRAEE